MNARAGRDPQDLDTKTAPENSQAGMSASRHFCRACLDPLEASVSSPVCCVPAIWLGGLSDMLVPTHQHIRAGLPAGLLPHVTLNYYCCWIDPRRAQKATEFGLMTASCP